MFWTIVFGVIFAWILITFWPVVLMALAGIAHFFVVNTYKAIPKLKFEVANFFSKLFKIIKVFFSLVIKLILIFLTLGLIHISISFLFQ